MSARDDYPQLARLMDKNLWMHHAEATSALDELDWLRGELGLLLGHLASTDFDWSKA